MVSSRGAPLGDSQGRAKPHEAPAVAVEDSYEQTKISVDGS